MTAAAATGFSSFDAALRLHDPWDTTLYNGVCFEGRKWHLLVDESSLDELPHAGRRSTPRYKAKAFQRFPILLRKVASKAAALSAAKAGACWRPGLSFVADLRHAGGELLPPATSRPRPGFLTLYAHLVFAQGRRWASPTSPSVSCGCTGCSSTMRGFTSSG